MFKKYFEKNERARDVITTRYTIVLDLAYAVGMNMFIVPAGIYSGGLMGVCQLIRTLLTQYAGLEVGFDIAGLLYYAMNIPIFLYAVNWMTDGNVFAEVPQNLPRHLANAHTFFKVLTAALLFPFIPQLARLCARLLPVESGKIKLQLLEPHLLRNPSAALDQVRAALFRMLRKSWKMVDLALEQHFIPLNDDPDELERIRRREQDVDRYQSEIMEYLSKLMHQKLTPHQSALIPELMHCANDIERIGDRAENILTLMIRMKTSGHRLSFEGADDLRRIFSVMEQQSLDTLSTIEKPDPVKAEAAIKAEDAVDELAEELESGHISRLRENKCSADAGIIFVELLSELTAISRHLGNIAERVQKA